MLSELDLKLSLSMSAESGLNWKEPIKLESIVVPKFPVECMPDVLYNYIHAVSESTQTSIDMASVAGLISLSICIQGKYIIKGNKDYKEPLNLYGVIIAPPAERKSSVMHIMTKHIFEYEQEKNAELQPLINENVTQRNIISKQIKELEDRAGKQKGDYKLFGQQAIEKKQQLAQMPELKPIRLIADDVSPEALTSLLAENGGKMSVISAEGGIFDILAGRYSNGINIDTFLKAHAGDSLRVDRKGRQSEYIKSPCLSVLLAIQPQVLEGLMENDDFRGRGLIGRFLYCYPVSTIGSRSFKGKPICSVYEDEYRKLIYDLLNIPNTDTPKAITLSDEAEKLIEAEFNIIEKRLISDLEGISEWAGKYIGAILRIAGLLHIALNKAKEAQVSSFTMKNAIEIGRYFLQHARLSFSIMGADKEYQKAKYILKQITKQYQTEISKRDIFNLCRGKFKKVDELEPSLELLEEYGYLIKAPEQEKETAGRKASPEYYINPYIYADNTDKFSNSAEIA